MGMKHWRLLGLSLLIVNLILVAVLIFRVYGDASPARVPDIVEQLLSSYTTEIVMPNTQIVFPFEEYISGAEVQGVDFHERMTAETSAFMNVLADFNFGVHQYTIEPINDNFCIMRYYDASGNLIPTPIGFWWDLGLNSKISHWRIARLVPFSSLDSEYSEVWDD